ncbi:MAG: exodeoxyribonuclease VII large subunit [Clostridiales bacterium]|jgi:exodeoxyribonuclease VII large subunit|nr:exodeoxyribonuclease VII large subunit [Clostridiales bacterium]
MKRTVLSVTQLNLRAKNVLETDPILSEAIVHGEISNWKSHTSGHLYFSLKDSQSSISCVMFRPQAARLKFDPENGLRVLALGHVSLYEKTGAYQLYVDYMEPKGIGAAALAFEQLKKKLAAMGVFDQDKKLPLPKYPKRVALITSVSGAAIRDIINVSRRRNPNVELVVAPALCQGEDAPKDLLRALLMVNKWGKADVIIMGRGGGSQEDLSPFNDEQLALAIADSKIPVVSAVGHETDFTISDFAAALRAPTPSAAAEIVVPSLPEMQKAVQSRVNRMSFLLKRRSEEGRSRLRGLTNRPVLKRPLEGIYNQQGYVASLGSRLSREAERLAAGKAQQLSRLAGLLESMSYQRTIERGFAMASTPDGKPLVSASAIGAGDVFSVVMRDGEIKSQALEVELAIQKE